MSNLPPLSKTSAFEIERMKKLKSMKTLGGFSNIANPFKLPSDEEIFLTREEDKRKMADTKEKFRGLKIWDKKTATTKASLKRINPQEFAPEFNSEESQKFNLTHRQIRDQAIQIVKSRIPTSYELKDPSRSEYINQKKEMFLVQMAMSTIQNETESLKQKADKKEKAFDESRKMLEEHKLKLNQLIENDTRAVNEKMEEVNKLTKEKTEYENDLKNIIQEEATKNNEKAKNEDLLKKLDEYKLFIEKLTNPEWLANEEQRVKDKIESTKNLFIENKIKYVDEKGNSDEISEGSKGTSKGGGITTHTKKKEHAKKGGILTSKQIYTAEFYALLEKGEIFINETEKLNQFERDLYFKNSEELHACFTEKEDNNLLLVQQIHELESSIEKVKNEYNKLNSELEGKRDNLQREKDLLIMQIREENMQISKMNNSSDSNNKELEKGVLNKLKNQLIERLFIKIDSKSDVGSKNSIELLTVIENRIEEMISKISLLKDQEKVKKIENRLLKEHKDDDKRINKEKLLAEEQDKKNKAKERENRPIAKMLNKPVMFRSDAPKLKKVKPKEEKKDEAAELRKYFEDL